MAGRFLFVTGQCLLRKSICLFVLLGMLLSGWANAGQPGVLHFSVLAFRANQEILQRWQPLADYIERALPGTRVVLEALDYTELDQAVLSKRVDLVLTQPAHYVALSARYDLYSPLATLVEVQQGLALTHFGGVILVSAQNTGIRQLPDLKGKRIAVSTTESLGGFQAQMYELQAIGITTKQLDIQATGKQDLALEAVRSGRADAAFVRSGLFEQMSAEGKIAASDYRVIQPLGTPAYPLALSTRLYPEWALAAMPWLDARTARQIASAVLAIQSDSQVATQSKIYGFTIPGDYRSVERLMRALRLPPYDQRVPLEVIWEDHRGLVSILLALFCLTAVWGLGLRLRSQQQKHSAEAALRESEQHYRTLANSGMALIWTAGTDRKCNYFNDTWLRFTGRTLAEELGDGWTKGIHPDDLERCLQCYISNFDQHQAFNMEYRLRHANGSYRWISDHGNPRYGAQGQFIGYIGFCYDITAMKEQQHQLEHIAHYDALTQLPNRMLLADRLQQAMAQAQRRHSMIAVAYIDLDGFKAVNDTYGHEAGDKLLIQVSGRMKEALREGDTLSRLGGDEFVAVMLDMQSHEASIPILDRLLATTAWPVRIDRHDVHVSASIGVSYYPQPEDMDADQLLRQADQAMYQAKQAGKNRYHLFDDKQDRAARGHRESIERVREALTNDELVLFYQPKVHLRTGEIIGAEALLRWQHPEQGLLPPAAFLPAVEEDDLIKLIGDWVIEKALFQMEAWKAQGLVVPVSVNIAARQLQSPEFLGKLKVALHLHPEVASWLQLEVLESSALEDISQASSVINACRNMEVGFALDDFGTGYSSLTYLKHLPAQALKIDQSFVRDMLEDPDDLAILDGILGMAEAFQRQVIAEGVETDEHIHMLLHLGCEFGQGYAIARPMPADNMAIWANAWLEQSRLDPGHRIRREELPILFAIVEHRTWATALKRYLQGEVTNQPDLDSRACRFGKWLDRSEPWALRQHPDIPAILSGHEALHDQAVLLLQQKETGQEIDLTGLETLLNDFINRLQAVLTRPLPPPSGG